MSLVQRVDEDLGQALKAGDEARVSTLRLLKNSLTAVAKAKQADLSDEEAVKVIQKEVKQRRDSVESYKKGSRDDLANKETEEIKLLDVYLPEQISDEELTTIIKAAVSETGATNPADTGKVMSAVMAKVSGRADGAKVSELVRLQLSQP